MRTSNPILSKPGVFQKQATGYPGQQPYPGTPGQQPHMGAPGQQPYPTAPGQQPYMPEPEVMGDRMTLDDVVAKTGVVMAILMVTAAVSWVLVPLQLASIILIPASLVAFITALVVSVRPKIPVGGVIFYAVVEGVLIGTISKVFELYYPGIVAQAALGTFVAAGATLLAYKFLNIRVTPRFRKFVYIGMLAFVGVGLVELVLSIFGKGIGLLGVEVSFAGLLFALIGATLAVFSLVLDFDSIETGIAAGAPAHESWRAAFGLTVSMVWLYINLLRILAYFRN